MENKELLTATQFSVEAKMGLSTVYRLLRENKLKYIEKRRGTQMVKYILQKELEKFK